MSVEQFNSLVGILLGAGTATSIGIIVTAIRKYRSGEIADDDAIILRLDKRLHSEEEARRKAVDDRNRERELRWQSEELAAKYKRQLIAAGLDPDE